MKVHATNLKRSILARIGLGLSDGKGHRRASTVGQGSQMDFRDPTMMLHTQLICT